MTKNALKLIPILSLFTFALVSTHAVLAENDATDSTATGSGMPNQGRKIKVLNETTKQEREEIRTTVKEQRNEIIKTKCEIVTTNVNNRLETFSENKEKHIKLYGDLKTRFQELIQRLDEKGYDTTKLEEDAQVLDEKIQKFAADYVIFIEYLTATKGNACGQSDGAFAQALAKAKAQLKIVRADAADVKNYYQEVIKPDIQALRAQKPVTTTESETEE